MRIKDFTRHPCFNKEAAGSCGRVHLPVAPKCNIQCGYCNRKYDCVNESRPGVTSSVLNPAQALEYMDKVLEREPRITVVGIAGPGDPFANPNETLTTIRLINRKYPHMIFCLSTNGLGILPYVDELPELGVSHVTITLNAVDPEIGARVYQWVRDGKVVYRGRQAAELLLERQLAAIKALKQIGMIVKVNTIVMPGINDEHIKDISSLISGMGVDIQNLIPLIPTQGTAMSDLTEPSKELINELRKSSGELIPQMTHCQRCRADAVGLLCKDRSRELAPDLEACSRMEPSIDVSRPYVAVASREGMLVNMHLGEATRLQIWEKAETGFRQVGERKTPPVGSGPKRWEELAAMLKDCRAVLCSAVGESPQAILSKNGVIPYMVNGFIESSLDAVYTGSNMELFKGRAKGLSACCKGGTGSGCV